VTASASSPGPAADPTDWRRWVVYQRERFPLLAHGPLIGAFAFAAVSVSAAGRGERPPWSAVLVAAATALVAFFQLRVIDEHKDAAEDARWRPYRAVPRGLVTLGELRAIAVAGAVLQATLAWWLAPKLLLPLVALWGMLALMAVEFGLGQAMHGKPLLILLSSSWRPTPTASWWRSAASCARQRTRKPVSAPTPPTGGRRAPSRPGEAP